MSNKAEELLHLIEEYEISMSDATDLRIAIKELANDEKQISEELCQVIGTLVDATDNFTKSIDEP